MRAIQQLRAGDVYGCYNFVSEDDLELFEELRVRMGSLVRLETRENNPAARTGSLYEANNGALDFAVGRYDFVSFGQADMQMTWWDQRILSRSQQIVDKIPAGERVAFYTQLPVVGKHAKPYERWERDRELGVFRTLGHVDVCLMPFYRGLNEDFRFVGTESEMAHFASTRGSHLIFHPFPFYAAIPFPITIRDNKTPRFGHYLASERSILNVVEGFEPDFASHELHPISLEEVVRPNGWACLYPYWPSDTNTDNWLRRRLQATRTHHTPFFGVVDKFGNILQFPWFQFAPGFWAIFLSVMKFLLRELKLKFIKS